MSVIVALRQGAPVGVTDPTVLPLVHLLEGKRPPESWRSGFQNLNERSESEWLMEEAMMGAALHPPIPSLQNWSPHSSSCQWFWRQRLCSWVSTRSCHRLYRNTFLTLHPLLWGVDVGLRRPRTFFPKIGTTLQVISVPGFPIRSTESFIITTSQPNFSWKFYLHFFHRCWPNCAPLNISCSVCFLGVLTFDSSSPHTTASLKLSLLTVL